MVTPSHRRTLVAWLRAAYQVSERRACAATSFARSSHCFRSKADPQDEHRLRLKGLASSRGRYGSADIGPAAERFQNRFVSTSAKLYSKPWMSRARAHTVS